MPTSAPASVETWTLSCWRTVDRNAVLKKLRDEEALMLGVYCSDGAGTGSAGFSELASTLMMSAFE